MRIAIIGSGAMGALYGGLFAENDPDADVTLLDIWEEHVAEINENGLRIERPALDEPPVTVDVPATTDPTSVDPVDLAIVFVKSMYTADAVRDADPLLGDDTDVMTLQNGLGNPERIAEHVPEERVIGGVSMFGSTLLGPGRIRLTSLGGSRFGRYYGANDDRVDAVADHFDRAGLHPEIVEEPRDAIWEKVLLNISVNPVAALARSRTGAITGTDAGRRLLDRTLAEGLAVARAEGRDLSDDIADEIKEALTGSGDSKPSMFQDVDAGRPTEIETLNGEVVRRAETHGIDVPVNRTLSDLVRLTEASWNEQ